MDECRALLIELREQQVKTNLILAKLLLAISGESI